MSIARSRTLRSGNSEALRLPKDSALTDPLARSASSAPWEAIAPKCPAGVPAHQRLATG